MSEHCAPSRLDRDTHRRGAAKVLLHRMPPPAAPEPPRPAWVRIRKSSSPRVAAIKKMLRAQKLVTVCEEARCPNLDECFASGTATFMIMGDLCTRRCAFCDVAHGRPHALDADEPDTLAATIAMLNLDYVVLTSVDRDDLHDGGAAHFAACIRALRKAAPGIRVEILTPDFRGRMERALHELAAEPCDVFNHNIETVSRLYRQVRPGSDYRNSLTLLLQHKLRFPKVPTKSGLMLGLGENSGEVEQLMRDLRAHRVQRLTIGQYLRPGAGYFPVQRYAAPDEFARLRELGYGMGFEHVASAPLVRSSYHAGRTG